MRDFLSDLSFTLRSLRKSPAFTIVAVLALALGIGANTTVASVVDALLNFPFPINEPERVVFVSAENPEEDVFQSPTSVDDFLDWREQVTALDPLVAINQGAFNLTGDGDPERLQAVLATPGIFRMVGYPVSAGRAFRPEDAEPGAPRVVILDHAFWQRRFGGDPGIVGDTIALDGEDYTVVGIGAEGFYLFNRNNALYVPLVLEPGQLPRDQRALFTMARLRDGVSIESAVSELRTVAQRLESEHPDTNEGWTATAVLLRDNFRQGTALAVSLLYGSISFVLLIACANVANLLLARASVRERELALRTALGAGRGRLIRQLLTESLVLALVSGALGLLIATWGIRALRDMLAQDVNVGFLAEVMELDGRMLLYTVLISALAGLLFGIIPAFQLSRPQIVGSLKEGGRGIGSPGKRWLRNGLVMAEVTLALALLGTSGALVRAFDYIYDADPGFDQEGLLTLQVSLPAADYPEDREAVTFVRRVEEQLREIPGVTDATYTSALPLSLPPGVATARLFAEGSEREPDDDTTPDTLEISVGADFFDTLDTEIVSGRALDERDREDSQRVAVISQTTARRFWPDADPVGRRLRLDVPGAPAEEEPAWLTVVGVSEDLQAHMHSLRNPTASMPTVFTPMAQRSPRQGAFVVRSSVDPSSLSDQVRQAVWNVDRTLPVDAVMTMDRVVAQVDTQNLFFLRVVTALSALAMILAGIGIYGVMAFSVNQRVREIGVRMALGANPLKTVFLVVRQAALLTVIGLIIGIGLAFVFVKMMASQLEGLQISNAGGPMTFAAVSAVLFTVAVLASLVPARRAVRVDPVEALRVE